MTTRLGQRPVTIEADSARVGELLAALGLADGPLHTLTIPGVPYSKSRPRFTRQGRAYHKSDDVDAEQRTGIYLRATVRRPYLGNVALACLFFRPNRNIVDADNLLKHVCDAANNVLWIDDSQCTGIVGIVDVDATDPRTVVAVGVHLSGLVRDRSTPPKPPKGALL